MTNVELRGLLAFSLLTSLTLGCGGSVDPEPTEPEAQLGLACSLQDELSPDLGGLIESEVWVEGEPPASICLVNHFRGRVSCPYGQTQADYDAYVAGTLAPTDPRLCRIADGSAVVEGVVAPQIVERRADLTVHRSCRCSDASGKRDDGFAYCDCAKGFTCEILVDDLGFASVYSGGYCAHVGTKYDPAAPKTSCAFGTPNCGYAGENP